MDYIIIIPFMLSNLQFLFDFQNLTHFGSLKYSAFENQMSDKIKMSQMSLNESNEFILVFFRAIFRTVHRQTTWRFCTLELDANYFICLSLHSGGTSGKKYNKIRKEDSFHMKLYLNIQ